MTTAKEKSLPLAIGLNLLAPGLGYMYMGKWLVGIVAFFLILGIYATAGSFFLFTTWLVMNVIMAIDMVILNNKNKRTLLEQNTKKCPNCAESIQREAKVCRFCGSKFEPV